MIYINRYIKPHSQERTEDRPRFFFEGPRKTEDGLLKCKYEKDSQPLKNRMICQLGDIL